MRLPLPITWSHGASQDVLNNLNWRQKSHIYENKILIGPFSYCSIIWLWRSVDWGMFSNLIAVANIKEAFVPWLKYKWKNGNIYPFSENSHISKLIPLHTFPWWWEMMLMMVKSESMKGCQHFTREAILRLCLATVIGIQNNLQTKYK